MGVISKKEKKLLVGMVAALLFTEGLFQIIEPLGFPPVALMVAGLVLVIAIN